MPAHAYSTRSSLERRGVNGDRGLSRRGFFRALFGAAAAAELASGLGPLESADASGARPAHRPRPVRMPERPLGRTGFQVRLFSLGGQATLEREGTAEDSLAIIHRAIDLGVNYIDTARRYGDGRSELYLGQVMKRRRNEVFLASKTRDRTYDGSMRSLEASLAALQTDHLDLWQLHNVMRDEDLDQIFATDGAIRALEKARDQKIVRFLGITGHYDPAVLRRGIERYPFDTLLVALNAADRHRASFIEHVLPVAVEKRMGIVGMKIPARGRLFREDGVRSMGEAMRYVLTLPVSTVVVGISTLAELEDNVRIAAEFAPLDAAGMRRLEELTKGYAREASSFKAPA
jgi:aryl-alcohol dehydrogenase-like predicted oxidoreductase